MPNTPRFPPNPPRVIEILAFPSVQLLDVTGPLQVFATANEIAGSKGAAPYLLSVVAPGGASVATSSGLALLAQPLPPMESVPDTLLVAGGPGVEQAASDAFLVNWLRDRAGRVRRVGSVCTGAFLLAEAGVLDGLRAVTHWSVCADLAPRFPAVEVEADPIFVRDGSVWTSGGVTAGIDLALALVQEDLGRSVALAVARYLVVFLKRPGGQAQFSTALSLQIAEDRFGMLHDWIAEHMTEDLSLPALARQAAMSERNFSRRYMEATGLTPARAVEHLRVESARQLLSDSQLSIKRFAQRCGFGSEETMRRSSAYCRSRRRIIERDSASRGDGGLPRSFCARPLPANTAPMIASAYRQQVRSSFLSGRCVLAPPMLGDLVASADPDPVVAQDVIDETGKRGGAPACRRDGSAERRSSSSASARPHGGARRNCRAARRRNPRPDPSPGHAKRVSLSSSVCGMIRCGRP
jgi:transcriptional regulator GlxA family with amidase domain